MADELEALGLERRTAWNMARGLARAERAGRDPLRAELARTAERLRARGHDPEEVGSAALLLLALGLRERGVDHSGVVERLRHFGDALATSTALESARVVRDARPDLDPDRVEAMRRRLYLFVFVASVLWGAIGSLILQHVR